MQRLLSSDDLEAAFNLLTPVQLRELLESEGIENARATERQMRATVRQIALNRRTAPRDREYRLFPNLPVVPEHQDFDEALANFSGLGPLRGTSTVNFDAPPASEQVQEPQRGQFADFPDNFRPGNQSQQQQNNQVGNTSTEIENITAFLQGGQRSPAFQRPRALNQTFSQASGAGRVVTTTVEQSVPATNLNFSGNLQAQMSQAGATQTSTVQSLGRVFSAPPPVPSRINTPSPAAFSNQNATGNQLSRRPASLPSFRAGADHITPWHLR